MVIVPASTGRDRSSSRAVIATDHTNSAISSGFIFFGFMLIVVEMKSPAPRRDDDTAAKCKKKSARNARGYIYE
jgi:hypothetical protein